MFLDPIALVLKNVNLGVEVTDDETHRVVECTFELAPFTPAHAEAFAVKSLLFGGDGLPKPNMDAATLKLSEPLQRVTWHAAPDAPPRIVTLDTRVDAKLHVKLKSDREPACYTATLKLNFPYPTAEDLLYVASGLKDQHTLLFEPMTGELYAAEERETREAPKPRHRRKPNGQGGEVTSV
jgi:hypothetical protein